MYFIPHVHKSDGNLSKIRVVFDAPTVFSSSRMLNDVVFTDPKLPTDLRNILLRNRIHQYIMTNDQLNVSSDFNLF